MSTLRFANNLNKLTKPLIYTSVTSTYLYYTLSTQQALCMSQHDDNTVDTDSNTAQQNNTTTQQNTTQSRSNNRLYHYQPNNSIQPKQHNYTYYVTEFAIGSVAGIGTGYTTKLFGRLVLVCSIGTLIGLQYLIWNEYLIINWQRVNANLQRVQHYATILIHEQLYQNNLIDHNTDITDKNWLVTTSSNILEKVLKLAGSQMCTVAGAGFTVGMIIGLKHG